MIWSIIARVPAEAGAEDIHRLAVCRPLRYRMVAMNSRTLLLIVIASCGISAQTPKEIERARNKEMQQLTRESR